MSEKDFECFARTGVNTPETMIPNCRGAHHIGSSYPSGSAPTSTHMMRWFLPTRIVGRYAVNNGALMVVGILCPGMSETWPRCTQYEKPLP